MDSSEVFGKCVHQGGTQRAAVDLWVSELAQEAMVPPLEPTPKRGSRPSKPKEVAEKGTTRSTRKPRAKSTTAEALGDLSKGSRTPKAKAGAPPATSRKPALKAATGDGMKTSVAGEGKGVGAGSLRASIDPKPHAIEAAEEEPLEHSEKQLTEEMREKLRARLFAARPGGSEDSGKQRKRGAAPIEVEDEDYLDGALLEDTGYVRGAKKSRPLSEGSQLAAAALAADYKARDQKQQAVLTLEDTKESTTKGWKNPLVMQALSTASSKRKKKKKGKGAVEQLTKAFTALVDGLKNKEGGEKKKKKKRRKVRLKNGVLLSVSDESSQEESTEEDEESKSSLSDCEAPLRKKSQQRPGSVLEMLTDHVRTSLDQAAATSRRETTAW